jgi:hypothetical protein
MAPMTAQNLVFDPLRSAICQNKNAQDIHRTGILTIPVMQYFSFDFEQFEY